jgi:ABC-type antimicrobial peptide transport system permease subunit
MIAVSAAIGGAGAWAANRVLQRLVDGMRAAEPSTVGTSMAILVIAALVASYIPARRAGRLDAMTALRQD